MKRALLVISLVAVSHAAVYIALQHQDWESDTVWSDQAGYRRLGEALATTGEFTRFPGVEPFVPEVIRTPGYPMFVALAYVLFGVGNNLAVAVAQALVYAGIAWLVFAFTKRCAGERAGVWAAALVALFSPLAQFSALILTELWTAFMATAAILAGLRAAQDGRRRDFALAGVLFSATTLVRPAFVLMPFFFAIGVPLLVRRQRTPRALGGWALLCATAVVTLMPWFAYNYVHLGQFALSPAGGVGRGLWEGSWQGRWPGRLQAELITLADTIPDRAELDARIRETASAARLPAEPMLQYVNEWRDIRAIWDTPTDPMERARARVVADQEYYRHAMANITADPIGHARRRLTRGAFVLWAADIPVPYQRINSLPPLAIRAMWLVQVGLLALAAWGVLVLARRGRWLEAVMLALPIIYVTGVHLPLLCEARQSLPVKPVVLALAGIALTSRRTAGS